MLRENDVDVPVSVIMTVYRDEKYLHEAVDSILQQSFTGFEFIIVIEAGADDSTVGILQDYCKCDNRIKLLYNAKRLGFAASLNVGMDYAKGKYIVRMDADDVALRNRLEVQYLYMEGHPELLVSGSSILIFGNVPERVQAYPETIAQIRNYTFWEAAFAHPTVIFNHFLMSNNNIRYNTDIKTEDYELWSRIVYNYEAANVPDVLLKYRVHDDNATVVFKEKVRASSNAVRANIVKRFLPDFSDKEVAVSAFKSSMEIERLENILYELYSDHSEIFNDKQLLRIKMYSAYNETSEFKRNGVSRYWNRFRALYNVSTFYIVKDKLWYTIKPYLGNIKRKLKK
jgi:glycosyltransferase involved in cell wall biosynthesis